MSTHSPEPFITLKQVADGQPIQGNRKTAEACSREPFITLKQAAEALGIKLYKIRRMAKDGEFPVYRAGNGRRLVRLSEVIAAIEASSKGGGDV